MTGENLVWMAGTILFGTFALGFTITHIRTNKLLAARKNSSDLPPAAPASCTETLLQPPEKTLKNF